MSDATAARALLAHFNHRLAGRLVRQLLKVENKEAWSRFSGAVLDLVPKAAEQAVWQQVLRYATEVGEEYVRGDLFRAKAKATIERRAETWLTTSFDQAVKAQVLKHVEVLVKQYDMQQFLKASAGKFQAYVDEELRRRAKESAS
jgi:hypothetical protein